LLLLDSGLLPPTFSWRLAFLIGALIGIVVLALRRHVPESPRWLMIHREKGEAETVVDEIEQKASGGRVQELPPANETIKLAVRKTTPLREIWEAMAKQQRRRSLLGFTLMVSQAFFYNAVLFTYGLVLLRYYGVSGEKLGLFLVPLALGNWLGPITIGRLFDTIGRKPMIAVTYIGSGVLLAITAWLFRLGVLTAFTQAICWSVTFFVASSAASAAYLTVSEIFSLEIRAVAISIFYACGTLVGGVAGPALYGYIVGTGSRSLLFWGYIAGAVLIAGGGFVELWLGIDAERQSLEHIARPLACRD
jgi:MFS family permease